MVSYQVVAALAAVCFLVSLAIVSGRSQSAWVVCGRVAGPIFFLLLIPPMLLRARNSAKLGGGGWLSLVFFAVLFEVAFVVQLLGEYGLRTTYSPVLTAWSYLAALVALGVGIAWLTQRVFGARMLSLRLDGAVVGFAVGSVAAAVRFQSIPPISGGALQAAVVMSHPTLDLTLLILIVAGLSLHNYRPHWSLALLMLGAAACVAGDVLYTRALGLHSSPGVPSPNSMWVVGVWLIAVAAWADPDERSTPRAATSMPHGLLMLPIGSGLVALSVIVMSLLSHVPRIALVLAACSLLLVIARMTLTLREARQGSLSFRDARTDELTGLSNRRGFLEAITGRLEARPKMRPMAVLLADLNGFKEVNDSLGHLAGDELLTIVGKRFAGALGGEATIARLGGDEFAMAFDVKCLDDAVETAKGLARTHSDPLTLDGVTVRVSASYGIAIFPAHGTTPLQLLRSADVAMYEAKTTRRTYVAYRAEHDRNSRSRLALVAELREAIESKDLILHYQPTRDLHTQEIRGVEALVRWQHPTRGILCPDDFIPMAERVGLVPSLSRVVLAMAITEASRQLHRDRRLQMSVNISRFDLLDDTLVPFIQESLEAASVPGDQLTLEITESSIGEDPERSRRAIELLRSLGVRVSIDDFGVGYSSMSQLLSLPLDEIKIDKSFILALRSDRRARAVISSAIELAKALDLTLVAEGIETEQSLAVLQELGADIGQGFFIAHPLTTDQLDDFLALGWNGHTAVTSSGLIVPEPIIGTA